MGWAVTESLRLASVVALCLLSLPSARPASVLFVADDAFFTIWAIDVETGATLQGFSVPAAAMGNRLPAASSGLALDGGELFYTHGASSSIWVLDPVSGAELRRLPKPELSVSSLGAGGGVIYGATPRRNGAQLYRLDALTGRVLGKSPLEGGKPGLTLAAARETIFASQGAFEIHALSTDSGKPLDGLDAPATIVGLAFDASREVLYALAENALVYELDPGSGEVASTIALRDRDGRPPLRPRALAFGELDLAEGDLPVPAAGEENAPATGRPIFELSDTTIPAGGSARMSAVLTSETDVDGFELAVAHDPRFLVLAGIVPSVGTAALQGEADFFAVDIRPNGGLVQSVLGASPNGDPGVLPGGRKVHMADLLYRTVARSVQSTVSTEVRFLDDALGSPPGENSVLTAGARVSAQLFDAVVTILPGATDPDAPGFFCGGPLGADGRPEQVFVRSGDRTELSLYYDHPAPGAPGIQGLTMVLEYDCRLEGIPESFRIPPDSIVGAIAPDFVDFQCDNDPDDGDGCEMVLGVLVDSIPPFDGSTLPPTTELLIVGNLTLELGGGVEVGECLDVRFRDDLNGNGNVLLDNIVSIENERIAPRTSSCQVCVTATGPSLYCGGDRLNMQLRPEPAVGDLGELVELSFWYSSPGEDVLAISQVLRFDCRLECIPGSFVVDAGLAGLVDPDGVQLRCDSSGADGDGCEVVVIVDQRVGGPGPLTPLPAANRPRRLGGAMFRILESAPRGVCLPVEHIDRADGDGTAIVSNLVVLASGAVSPQVFDCEICVRPSRPARFLCGGPSLDDSGLPSFADGLPVGARTEICFWYTSPVDDLTGLDDIQALTVAVAHDCNLICRRETFRIPPGSALEVASAEFVSFDCEGDQRDGDGCELVLGVLVDALPPFDGQTLPATDTPLPLACVEFEVGPAARLGSSLEIRYQNGVNIGTAPPLENEYTVASQSRDPETRDCGVGVRFLGPRFFCGGGSLGPDGLPVPASGLAGQPAEVCLWYSSPVEPPDFQAHALQGLSMVLSHDCEMTCIESSIRVPDDSILDALEVDFLSFQCDTDPGDGDGCEIVFAALLDALPPFAGQTLPPTDVPLKLACFDIRLPPDAECNECFALRFENGLNGRGEPLLQNVVVFENRSYLARTTDCEVCVTRFGNPLFRRGDCNFDDEVDVSDPAAVLSFIFGEGTWKFDPPCVDACDANDDARVDLADAFTILRYLYRLDAPPPPPGPVVAGTDPTRDKIECDIDRCPEP